MNEQYPAETLSAAEKYSVGSKVKLLREGPDSPSWKIYGYNQEQGDYLIRRPSAAPGGFDLERAKEGEIAPLEQEPVVAEPVPTVPEPQPVSPEPLPIQPAQERPQPRRIEVTAPAPEAAEASPTPIGVWRSAQGTDRETDLPVLEILSGPETEQGEEYIKVKIQAPEGEREGYIPTREFLEGNPDELARMTLPPAPEMPQPTPQPQPELAPEPAPQPIEPAPEPAAPAEPEPIPAVPAPQPETTPVEPTAEHEAEAEEPEAPNNPPADLSPENKNFFAKMSERGKRLSKRLYEGSYKTLGVEKIRGRLDLAYNQFWADRYQKKAVNLKGEMDGLSTRIEGLDIAKGEMESQIESLRQQKLPGAEQLQLRIQGIEREKMELLNKKDVVQSELEAMDNQAKLYTNERDKILDGHISKYDERLKPMEKKLEALQTSRDEVELLMAVMQAKHKDQQARLEEIENRKEQTEEALRKAGMSEKEVMAFAATKELDRILSETRAKMAAEQEELNARMTEINKKIAKEDAKANPYRDKRERYIRLKGSRPIKIKVPARQRGEAPTAMEQTTAHTREAAEGTVGGGGDQAEVAAETTTAPDNRPTVEGHLGRWNGLLGSRFGEEAQSIDLNDFLAATKLNGNYKLGPEDFTNIIDKYVKLKKLSVRQFNKTKKDFSS